MCCVALAVGSGICRLLQRHCRLSGYVRRGFMHVIIPSYIILNYSDYAAIRKTGAYRNFRFWLRWINHPAPDAQHPAPL